MDSLKAAANNGCDAIYIGGKAFSARKNAENFDDVGLEAAIDYAHLRGVKVYVAVNTLYKDSELPALAQFCAQAYRFGADALIVQDIGAAELIQKEFEIDIHASTQLTVRTDADAEFLKRFGFKRFILSRETTLDEIKRITALGYEAEVFAHGALCYSHSGQCLMSAFIGGRSGNRGNCAQPCRLKYRLEDDRGSLAEGNLLSPKDMLTLDIIPEIVGAGVAALKIEGRMKNPQYVALVTKAYRDCIDGVAATDEIKAELAQVFSRGGEFCAGYFKAHSSREMMGTSQKSSGVAIGEVVKYIPQMGKCVMTLSGELVGGDGIYIGESVGAYYNSAAPAQPGDIVTVDVSHNISHDNVPKPSDKVYKSFDKRLDGRLKTLAAAEARKLTLIGSVEAKIGGRLRFTLEYLNILVTEYGAVVERAEKNPVTRERLLYQLAKMGGTPFSVEFSECDIEEDIYTNIKEINEVRRKAVAEMERRIIQSYKRNNVSNPSNANDHDGLKVCGTDFAALQVFETSETSETSKISSKYTVLVNRVEQAMAVIESNPSRVYLEGVSNYIECLEQIIDSANGGAKIFAALPPCLPPDGDRLLEQLEASGIDGYLVRTYGHLQKLENLKSKKEIALDYSFNVMNSRTFAQLAKYAQSICLSSELRQVSDISVVKGAIAETLVFGRLTLMTSNLCPVGISAEKGSDMHCRLRGKPGTYILTGRNGMVFPIVRDCESCTARVLSPINDNLIPDGEFYLRLDFTTETPEECRMILIRYI